MKKLPRYKMVLNKEDQGVYRISLVDNPAIEKNWIYLSKQEADGEIVEYYFSVSKDKKMLYGPILVPNKDIYRKNDKLGEHYIFFESPEIEEIAYKFQKDGLTNSFNLMHEDIPVKGFIAETRIIRTEGDITALRELGYKDEIEIGTWFAGVKIEDEDIWKELIKSEKLKGFSVEILSGFEPVNLQKNNNDQMNNENTEKKEELAVDPTVETQPANPAPTEDVEKADISREDVAAMIDARFSPLMEEITALKDLIAKLNPEAKQEEMSAATEEVNSEVTETNDIEGKLREMENKFNMEVEKLKAAVPAVETKKGDIFEERLSKEVSKIDTLISIYKNLKK